MVYGPVLGIDKLLLGGHRLRGHGVPGGRVGWGRMVYTNTAQVTVIVSESVQWVNSYLG